MRPVSDFDLLDKASFLVGAKDALPEVAGAVPLTPFCEQVLGFLDEVSKRLLADRRSRAYSDVVTFAFWIRKASTNRLRDCFARTAGGVRLGRGVVFHIAPSNVPVNFAYSCAAGLLCGNANVVRVPSKDFAQVSIIVDAFGAVIEQHEEMAPYVTFIRYDRDKDINDVLSAIADVRIVWGGDNTIYELRKSPLPPRSTEVTFADRYSIAVIDSDAYFAREDKARVAQDFYNDTFFSDQNACSSPRVVVWTGTRVSEAKELFWQEEYLLVSKKYSLQPIQAVNKLTSADLVAAKFADCVLEERKDNLILRMSVAQVTSRLMEYRENSGFFFEYDCEDILEIRDLCNDKKCQTIAYLGEKSMFTPLIESGIRGVDRIVPIGRSMDFDLIWDGYDLPAVLTRVITVE